MKQLLKNTIPLCLFYIGALSAVSAQNLKYGLEFNSFETVQEKRTGLNLTPSRPFSFQDGFSLSFDVSVQLNKRFNYGYIFRIVGQNSQHIDFLFNRMNFIVTHSSGKMIADFSFDDIAFESNVYYPFEILFEPETSALNISFGGKKVSTRHLSLKDFAKVNIVFGKCNDPKYQASDIPKMRIKDIRINNHKGTPVYHWSLSKHAPNGVYDDLKKQFAWVENPQWILDTHSQWKTNISLTLGLRPQICYQSAVGAIGIFDRNRFYLYDINTLSLQKKALNEGMPDNFYTNQTIYHPFMDSYYAYFEVKDIVNAYDTIGNRWNVPDKERIYESHLHHNKFISPSDSCLYVFGGYGHHKYNNEIYKYDFKTKVWEHPTFGGDIIHPRYLSGLGIMDENRVLVFGGYGSETGAQELSPRNFYDLYIIDIKERTINKVWELSSLPAENFTVANSMVVDTLNKCFYALCFPQQQYNTSLFLGKFSLEKPEYEIVTDSIPYLFQDIHSYADLFLNDRTNELVAITATTTRKDSSTLVSIYTLAYPPVSERDLLQREDLSSSLRAWLSGGIISFSVLLLLGGGIVYLRKKKRKRAQQEPAGDEPINTDMRAISAENIQSVKVEADRQAIFILGGFQVIDRDGNDITGEFSPLLKQLFLILLLNTLKDGNGISSQKLRETFWYDKSQESARNNRGVFLSRLRQILNQVGAANIENLDSHWMLELKPDIFCDYSESVALIRSIKNGDFVADDVRRLLSIVARGEMLQSLQVEWLDPFKSEFSNDLVDVLLDVAQKPELCLSPREQIDLADVVFIHDYLNEDALRLKCRTLIKMKKNGFAKNVYASFCKEYQASFGIIFKDSFEQIISSLA